MPSSARKLLDCVLLALVIVEAFGAFVDLRFGPLLVLFYYKPWTRARGMELRPAL